MLQQNIPVDFQVIVDFSNETISNSKTEGIIKPGEGITGFCY
jgi:hypothetical protein